MKLLHDSPESKVMESAPVPFSPRLLNDGL